MARGAFSDEDLRPIATSLVDYLIDVLVHPLDHVIYDWRYEDGGDQFAVHDVH